MQLSIRLRHLKPAKFMRITRIGASVRSLSIVAITLIMGLILTVPGVAGTHTEISVNNIFSTANLPDARMENKLPGDLRQDVTIRPLRLAQNNNRPGGSNSASSVPGRTKPPKRTGTKIPAGTFKPIIDLANQPKKKQPPKKKTSKPKVKPKKKTKSAKKKKSKPRRSQTATIPRRSPVGNLPLHREREIVVLLASDRPADLASELAQTHQLELLDRFDSTLLGGSLQRYRVAGNGNVDAALSALRNDSNVDGVHNNSIFYAQEQSRKYARIDAQYALKKIKLVRAHDISRGRDVKVAIIDSGIDLTHPDISENIVNSFNAVQDSEYRAHAHGTAIAGIISANGEVQGVAPMAKLLAVRAFFINDKKQPAETSSFILMRGIEWAYDKGSRIFNLSFAGPHDPLLKKMLNRIHKQDGVLIAAAGNGGVKAGPAYPGAYRNVLAVTAIDEADKLYKMANRGHYVFASAPGVDILVTSPEKKYRFSTGTSLAAAHVSGLVALLRATNPKLSNKDIRRIVEKTSFDLGPKGRDKQFGAGRVDANASLRQMPRTAKK
ncbi:MAG: S8 family peptidase [Methyloligellaceae bacterium]